jgi:hypothetical protein
MRRLVIAPLALLALLAPAAANAQEPLRWYFQTSLYTIHFSPDPRHDNTQKLLNLEYHRDDRWLAGGAVFDNSFGQFSQYLYVGKTWTPFERYPNVYVKLTGGLVHGYKGEFRDKIPLNRFEIAPAALPAIGVRGKRFGAEAVLFGTAGLMFTAGVYF